MKKFMQRMLQMTAAFALIVVVGVCMTACGGDNNNDKDSAEPLTLDQIQGLYGNVETREVYYFNGDDCYRTYISINETKDDGWQSIKYNRQINELYKVRIDNEGYGVYLKLGGNKESLFTTTKYCQGLPESFVGKIYSDKTYTYSKFSSLTEFAQTVFPFEDGYKIDPNDTSALAGVWEDIMLAA